GETSKTIDIAILQDSLMEGDETFSVALSNVMNGVIIDASGQATITDDEPSVCGVPSYDKANEQVMLLWKDCQTGAWSVRATGGGAATTVSFVGDVVAGQDILSISGFSLEGADTLDNTTDSKRIHFVLKVAGTGQDGYQFTPATDAGTCFDLQNPGIPVLVGANRTPITGAFDLSTLSACTIMSSISIDDVTVSEADATASFTVSLSAVSNDAVIIDYVTQAGTATADTDYTHVDTPITLTFAPGETSKTIDIAILQDMLVEDVENFTVKLSNATAATLADTTGIATIIDDEVNACGQPSFIPSIDQAVYLWRDCGTDNWHLAATAGGTATQIIYLGDVTSDQPLTNINPVSIEVNDILDSNSDPAIVDFSLKMKNTGSDGFDFTTSNGTNTCFTVLPASQGGGTVIVGAAKTVFTAPFDLETLGACQ
ncbi:MAG: Calx-beta domain-containing protein, partial [Gammaproteobacteria bacterium]